VTISFPALLVTASDLKMEELVEETLKLVKPCFANFEEKCIELADQLALFEAA
jgi:hypothetical protein